MPADDLSIIAPENLRKVINDESSDDCLACRVTGGGAFIGLGAYSWYTGMQNLQANHNTIRKSGSRYGIGARRLGIRGISVLFIGMGVYRLLN